jgi:hypothetical protein
MRCLQRAAALLLWVAAFRCKVHVPAIIRWSLRGAWAGTVTIHMG